MSLATRMAVTPVAGRTTGSTEARTGPAMTPDESDAQFMRAAMAAAADAATTGEVPVGAVVVHEGAVVVCAANRPIAGCDPTAHAEMRALRVAARRLRNYRLARTTLYVTLEPCIMCVGAILHARVGRVVFGAYDPAAGAVVSRHTLLAQPHHYRAPEWRGGVLRDECAAQLQAFFAQRRRGGGDP